MGAKARARVVILAFHIEDDNRASPGQQVRNDDADTFARAGRGFDNDMLAATKGQEPSALAAKDDSRACAKPVALYLACASDARVPVQRCAARPTPTAPAGPEQAAADRPPRPRPDQP